MTVWVVGGGNSMGGRASQLSSCNWGGEKRLDVADFKGRIFGYTPPRVFCKKRLDWVDSKGVDFFEKAQEAVIA
jgi:hypothetical protein